MVWILTMSNMEASFSVLQVKQVLEALTTCSGSEL